ncbi:MAG: translation initiation factor IF-3 [Acidimicrobiaceae bacterium]|nr:translation initiation factor IF-3 [Acidimicrobiaceae bacterium]
MSAPNGNEPRVNERIRAREVRLVDPEGNQLGIKLVADALVLAKQMDLDLVEVAPMASPPVARIMDYGKFKFDAAQKARESRRRSSAAQIKEMKYRPKIGVGDFDTKTKQVIRFLNEGHKVKITIMFRGREIYHPEIGKSILDRVAENAATVGKVETAPKLDGRNMLMVLAPDKRVVPKPASADAGTDTDVEPEEKLEVTPVEAVVEPPQVDIDPQTDQSEDGE